MKTFRFIGMALFAVLMCVNFTSCSGGDDDPTEEPEEGGVVVNGKNLVKIVGKSANGSYSETYTFSYDNKGRLIAATEAEEEGGYKETDTFELVWGDDAIKVTEKSTYSGSIYTESYIFTLKNGLVQYEDEEDGARGTYTYNSSNKLIKYSNSEDWTNTAIWDGDKLVSISDSDDDATLKYGNSCKKGYFPFIATMIDTGECPLLFMAHPEIAGMRTTQLPTSITWTHTDDYSGKTDSETSTMEYEFDKEGYISKIIGKETDSDGSTDTYIYTLTWQ